MLVLSKRVLSFLEEDIFQLDVTMHNIFGVHVGQTGKETAHDYLDFLGLEKHLLFHVLVELAALEELQAHVEGVLRFEDLVQFHDVGVVQLSHDLNLVDESFLLWS